MSSVWGIQIAQLRRDDNETGPSAVWPLQKRIFTLLSAPGRLARILRRSHQRQTLKQIMVLTHHDHHGANLLSSQRSKKAGETLESL